MSCSVFLVAINVLLCVPCGDKCVLLCVPCGDKYVLLCVPCGDKCVLLCVQLKRDMGLHSTEK